MKYLKCIKNGPVFWAFLLLTMSLPFTQALAQQLEWKRVEGVIVPGTATGGLNVVAGIQSVVISWSTRTGEVRINLETGQVKFRVDGLALAAQEIPAPVNPVIGVPSPLVTLVKGTLICNADTTDGPIFDTEAVSFFSLGRIRYSGEIPGLPADCPNAAFLLRVADENMLKDRWIAHGAVRVP